MNPNQSPQPQTPNDTWPITRDDKVEIQELGRKLQSFLQGEFKDRDQVHLKIVVGAFNYIMDLQTQKTKLIGDDFIVAEKSVKAAKLEDRLEEPFTVEPEAPEPTLEEQIEAARQHLATLEGQREVDNASPAPTEGADPMPSPSPSPSEGAALAADPAGPGAGPVTDTPASVEPAAEPTEPAPAAAPVATDGVQDKPAQGQG